MKPLAGQLVRLSLASNEVSWKSNRRAIAAKGHSHKVNFEWKPGNRNFYCDRQSLRVTERYRDTETETDRERERERKREREREIEREREQTGRQTDRDRYFRWRPDIVKIRCQEVYVRGSFKTSKTVHPKNPTIPAPLILATWRRFLCRCCDQAKVQFKLKLSEFQWNSSPFKCVLRCSVGDQNG